MECSSFCLSPATFMLPRTFRGDFSFTSGGGRRRIGMDSRPGATRAIRWKSCPRLTLRVRATRWVSAWIARCSGCSPFPFPPCGTLSLALLAAGASSVSFPSFASTSSGSLSAPSPLHSPASTRICTSRPRDVRLPPFSQPQMAISPCRC